MGHYNATFFMDKYLFFELFLKYREDFSTYSLLICNQHTNNQLLTEAMPMRKYGVIYKTELVEGEENIYIAAGNKVKS